MRPRIDPKEDSGSPMIPKARKYAGRIRVRTRRIVAGSVPAGDRRAYNPSAAPDPRDRGGCVERSYYQEYFFFEQDNWWFVSRRRILMSLLRRHLPRGGNLEILDAGCGTGINLDYLAEFGTVIGADVSEEAIEFCRRRGNSSVRRADLRELDWPDASFDLVTALDVIEHIDRDDAAVHELARVTKPGGHLLVTVPAFPALWSAHDEINHHMRRYRGIEIRELVTRNGCEIVKFTHMNTFLFPVAYAVRTWQQLRKKLFGESPYPPRTDFVDYHPVVNAVLTAIFTAEVPLVTLAGLPFGLSILCFARKRSSRAVAGPPAR
jgi:SAM-dependent methyltransferase